MGVHRYKVCHRHRINIHLPGRGRPRHYYRGFRYDCMCLFHHKTLSRYRGFHRLDSRCPFGIGCTGCFHKREIRENNHSRRNSPLLDFHIDRQQNRWGKSRYNRPHLNCTYRHFGMGYHHMGHRRARNGGLGRLGGSSRRKRQITPYMFPDCCCSPRSFRTCLRSVPQKSR